MTPIRGMILAAAFAVGATAAHAQDAASEAEDGVDTFHCLAQKKTMEGYLASAYSERRVANGELENGNRMTLYASRQGSWTLVEELPDGQTCVKASGKSITLG